MSHEDFANELNALRETLPAVVEEATASKTVPQSIYTIELAERICEHVARGKSLLWIARQSEMPAYSTLLKWSKEHPELSQMLRSVRDLRARHFEDAAIEAAENAIGKDADRLKVDTYKWAAEVNDPTTYGKKLAHSGEVKGQVILQVVTGFGEPNEWQKPPKLNPDGTVDKTPVIEVTAEVADGRNADADAGADNEARSSDPSHVSSDCEPGGLSALPAVPGHEADA